LGRSWPERRVFVTALYERTDRPQQGGPYLFGRRGLLEWADPGMR